MSKPTILGLVLTGGGARAAYQVGVLKAIAHMFPALEHPFQVITGTSAGAINTIGIAGGGDIFNHTVDQLNQLWSDIEPEQVYRADIFGLSGSMTRFLQGALMGESATAQAAMLNNAPLRKFLEQHLHFDKMADALRQNKLRAVGINASGYSSGRNICFFDGHPEIESWELDQRTGVREQLTLNHVMASAAIPTIFPPVKLHREYFGDGATRQMAHLSPALHLGADRLMIIGVSANRTHQPQRKDIDSHPNMGQIMDNVLNGMFLDTLEFDIERLQITNTLLSEIPASRRDKLMAGVRYIPYLEISPTQPIFEIARKHLSKLPTLIRRIMGRNLHSGEGGISLASYLMFDKEFCRELIRLGYADAQKKATEIENFFSEGQTSR